jgi:hypothetical protein
MDARRFARTVAASVLLVTVTACGRPAAPAASPTVAPSSGPVAPTASPTAAPYQAAIAAFVEQVTSGDLSYRIRFTGDARASVDVLPVKGTLDVDGADFATSFTYDFSQEYDDLGKLKVQVRSVDGKGWIKRPEKAWTAIKGYDAADSAVPFKAIGSSADVRYLGSTESEAGAHRISVPGAVLIHPNTIPFRIKKEKIDQTTLEVVLDDAGTPLTGAWTLRGQARVGGGIGQLQRIVYELALDFSKVGEPITIERP